MISISESRTIAEIIFSQIGAHRFLRMTGAKVISIIPNGISFSLPSEPGYVKDGIVRVDICLTPADLYVMSGYCLNKGVLEAKTIVDGVYADALENIFESMTGLFTHL